MVFRQFSIQIILRVLTILALCIALSWAWQYQQTIYIRIVLLVLLSVCTFLLIRYVNNTNRQMERFLISLRDHDSHYKMRESNISKTNHRLTQLMNESFELLKEARFEKEKQMRFLEYFLDQGGYTFLVINKQKEITLSSQATAQLFGLSFPFRMSEFMAKHPSFMAKVEQLSPGEVASYSTLPTERGLLIRSNLFTLGEEPLILILVDDISREQIKMAFRAWDELLRVINHEIMNSLTPVINLTQASKKILSDGYEGSESVPAIADVKGNLDLIEERFKGLVRFLSGFQAVRDIPDPVIAPSQLSILIQNAIQLCHQDCENYNIKIETKGLDDQKMVMMDTHLIEQVMINLLKNAIESFDDQSTDRRIWIRVNESSNRTTIRVSDNGSGIPEEILHRIFLPFFSTRKKGSGIGLAVCQQIINLHGSKISVRSSKTEGTSFTFDLVSSS